tara:strand:- start:58 stop:1380 length:1323 start_codon:yes stop_codon:yes gene_type:complete
MSSYSDNVIKQSIGDFISEKSRHRRLYVEKLIDYYTGTNADGYISHYFGAGSFQEIPRYHMNITRKFIDKMSRIYTAPPERKLKSKSLSKKYDELTRYKNTRFKHIEKMTNLIGTIATYVYVEEKADGLCIEHRPIYYFDVFFDESNPYDPVAIVYPMLKTTDSPSYLEESFDYCYWDSEQKITYNSQGAIIEEVNHNLGVLPFVFTRDIEQIDDFFAEGASDIVDVNEHLNIIFTEACLGLRFQMFGQPWASGVYDDDPLARMGSDTIINLPQDGKFGIESPQGDLSKVIEFVKFQIEMLAQSRHMYVNFDSNQDRPSSGLALKIKDFDRMEDYHDDIDRWRNYEHDFFYVEKILASNNGIDLGDNLIIDFKEPEYPRSVGEQIQRDEWMLSKGYITDEEILMREKGDISLEDAKRILKQNRANMPDQPEEAMDGEVQG